MLEAGLKSRLRSNTIHLSILTSMVLVLSSCGSTKPAKTTPTTTASSTTSQPSTTLKPSTTTTSTTTTSTSTTTTPPRSNSPAVLGAPLAAPAALTPFSGTITPTGEGTWSPAGRLVGSTSAIYETTLVPPGGSQPAGIAWMDTNLLSARLYSGSMSPGGGPYRYSAPIQPAQAASLVAAFNGGFVMKVAGGGYYTQHQIVDPLVQGAASLVIYSNGSVNIGAWGSNVTMTPNVVSVRQNLVPLVAGGQPTPQASNPNWMTWGATCGATSCIGPGIENQWRSGIGITANGALVYVTGPALDPLQLAQLLVHAGAIRAMQLDINPDWTVFVAYNPSPGSLAGPSNGTKLLSGTVQGPWTFFQSWWARDFITMSARSNQPG